MAQRKSPVDRRKFLAGVLTGGGVVAALAATVPKPRAGKAAAPAGVAKAEPVLYRRTKDVERYYKTLYV